MTDTQTPERIWVRYSPNGHGTYVSSCEPSDIDELDVPFVHADLHDAVVTERDQLKAQYEELVRTAVKELLPLPELTELEKHRG